MIRANDVLVYVYPFNSTKKIRLNITKDIKSKTNFLFSVIGQNQLQYSLMLDPLLLSFIT